MKDSRLICIFTLFFLVAFPAISGDSSSSNEGSGESVLSRFSAEQQEKLLAGEVVFEYVLKDTRDATDTESTTKGYGKAITIVNAPVEEGFKIFCQHEKEYLYFPRMTVSKVLKTHGNEAIVYKELDYTVATVRYTHVMTIVPEAHRVDFTMDPTGVNDIKASEGYFQFESFDDKRSLFTYALLNADIGVAVPEFIKKYISSRDLPEVAANVKKRIESGGKWEK